MAGAAHTRIAAAARICPHQTAPPVSPASPAPDRATRTTPHHPLVELVENPHVDLADATHIRPSDAPGSTDTRNHPARKDSR
jgi:hypothetical protein